MNMNPKLPLIEKYIQKLYPEVLKVDFIKRRVYVANADIPEDDRIIIRDIIEITINNINKEILPSDLRTLINKIADDIDETFSLNMEDFNSKYDTEFFVATTLELNTYLKSKGYH